MNKQTGFEKGGNMNNDNAYRYFVKSRFYGWRQVNAEQYARFVDVIRKGASAMTAEKKEEYIQKVTRKEPQR